MKAIKEGRLVILMLNGIVKIIPLQCQWIKSTETEEVEDWRVRGWPVDSKAEEPCINQVICEHDVVLWVVALR
jgi:hypothetical protein